MNIEIPEFQSNELRQAAEFFSTNVSQHKERLDAISNDIKKVEKWFEDLGLRLEISEQFSRKTEESLGDGGSAPQVKESLAWALDERTQKWRLCYVRTVEECDEVRAEDEAAEEWTEQKQKIQEAPVERIIQATRALLKSLVRLPVTLVRAPGSLGKKVWRHGRKGVTTRTEVRPLIETPVEIRLRAFAHLPAFLQEAGKRLEFRPAAQPTP